MVNAKCTIILIPRKCMLVFLTLTSNKRPDHKSEHDGLLQRIFIFAYIYQLFHASMKAQHLTHCSTRKRLLLFFSRNISNKVLK